MKLTNQNGTTIIEVLVSILIVAITAAGGIALYLNASEVKSIAVHKKMAAELLNSKMEAYRNKAYSAVSTESPSDVTIGNIDADVADGLGQTAVVSVVTDPVTGQNYKEIQVSISWKMPGQMDKTYNVSATTFKMQ